MFPYLECNCNGQSKCQNGTNICIKCNENVVGKFIAEKHYSKI